ncbi:MAG: acylphosphatase, partial [Planctomycetaceae bacterium]|nr:acylphosphatase [Planctomycetaceae bacterium]
MQSTTSTTETARHRIAVHGLVQGVGFRPFIFRLAQQCRLNGFVCNDLSGVI